MSAIGGRTVLSIRTPSGEAWVSMGAATTWGRIDPWWADGVSFQEGGAKSPPSQAITTIDLDTVGECNSEYDAYRAMQTSGSGVTVIDDHGTSTSNVKVLGVQRIAQIRVEQPVGGIHDGHYVLKCAWTLQETSTS